MSYIYGMRNRGYAPGNQPRGVNERRDDPQKKYYDIILYDKKLPLKEEQYYDLVYLGKE